MVVLTADKTITDKNWMVRHLRQSSSTQSSNLTPKNLLTRKRWQFIKFVCIL